jgi:hypothetical protein
LILNIQVQRQTTRKSIGTILIMVVTATTAQSLCVITLYAQMGSTWQAVGELQQVTVPHHAQVYQTMQCGAAMAEPALLAAHGFVMLTM